MILIKKTLIEMNFHKKIILNNFFTPTHSLIWSYQDIYCHIRINMTKKIFLRVIIIFFITYLRGY